MMIPNNTARDWKKFRHTQYPPQPQVTDFLGARKPLFGETTPITSMGSCFALNVAKYLRRSGLNYLSKEDTSEFSAHWDYVYSTANLRQIFEYSLTDEFQPAVRWWPHNKGVQDPFRRKVVYAQEHADQAFQAHRAASREALTEAQVVILTLGLIETWRDKRDGYTYYRVPSPRFYDPQIHEFHIQMMDEALRDLLRIRALLDEHNPQAELVLSVSPVPLFATFRTDVDAVQANALSKSTLRVAAEYAAHSHPKITYFPSYEIVMHASGHPFQPDGRHVRDEVVSTVMDAFRVKHGPLPEAH